MRSEGSNTPVVQVISHLFRHESGRMAAVLARLLGPDELDTAHDIVQDALVKAMEVWPFHGIPQNPSAWLYKVAKNKAIDHIRAIQSKTKAQTEIQIELKSEWGMSSRMNELFRDEEIQDSVLRMAFVCCHPSIPPESQIALTLKTLGGLTSLEIAHAFLTSEETITKRIYRAKEKIKEEHLSLEFPVSAELMMRMDSVLKVLYLLFNEGYNSSHPNVLIREDLCEEAMRLCYLLVQNKETNLPKVRALMALMCLQTARFPSRVNDAGAKILLQDQDRSKWNQPLVVRGLNFLRDAFSGDQLTEYHVEAAIASVHSIAKDFSDTNWKELLRLYETLYEMKPSPMVALNKAIALGYAHTPLEGIQALEKIIGLKDHYLYLASLGNFHIMNGDKALARKFFSEAMTRTTSNSELELLKRKIDSCSN